MRRAVWDALIPGALLFMTMQVVVHARGAMIGADSHAYWVAARHPETWYTLPPEYRDAFLYAPVFAQVLVPLGQLPWPVFQGAWIAGQTAVLCWLLAPLGWRRALSVAPFLVSDLLVGNLYFFFAAALVLAVRREPGALALPALTKIAPAVVGVWFLVRGEWRPLLRAVTATLVIVLLSCALAPEAWMAWLTFLSTSAEDRGLMAGLRLLLALAVVVYAAKTGRAWLLAPALILACPVLGGYGPLAVLAAIPRLLEHSRHERSRRPGSSAVVRPELIGPSSR